MNHASLILSAWQSGVIKLTLAEEERLRYCLGELPERQLGRSTIVKYGGIVRPKKEIAAQLFQSHFNQLLEAGLV